MKVYIAASWKHQHAVEMMTRLLRDRNIEVMSFVENNNEDPDCKKAGSKALPFDEWIYSESGSRSFEFDTGWAMRADMVVYIGPSGKDAAAELGMAFARGVPIVGLYAKGEDFGLMRRIVSWKYAFMDVVEAVLVREAELSRPLKSSRRA